MGGYAFSHHNSLRLTPPSILGMVHDNLLALYHYNLLPSPIEERELESCKRTEQVSSLVVQTSLKIPTTCGVREICPTRGGTTMVGPYSLLLSINVTSAPLKSLPSAPQAELAILYSPQQLHLLEENLLLSSFFLWLFVLCPSHHFQYLTLSLSNTFSEAKFKQKCGFNRSSSPCLVAPLFLRTLLSHTHTGVVTATRLSIHTLVRISPQTLIYSLHLVEYLLIAPSLP